MSRRLLPLLAFAALAGCVSDPVAWREVVALSRDTLPGPGVQSEATGYPYRLQTPGPVDPAMCPGSLVFASDPHAQAPAWPLFAAWLHVRPDSTVAVVAARYGGAKAPSEWSKSVVVDSVDVGKFGCNRPGPSIAVTGLNVHVSYSLEAPEGFGVFFAHSMDNGVSFHSPMIIVYGDRLSATATAAENRRVAVAYENPSGSVRRVEVAVSSTDGHTFEPRVPATPDEMNATRPRIAIHDTVVSLSFAGDDTTRRALRVGDIRK